MTVDVSLKILLVDSSRFFRTIEKQFLAKTPAEVFEAESGEAGLVACRDQKPDLVYLSYELSDMDGPLFCRRLKSEFGIRNLPIVMVCDENSPEQKEASRKAGSDGVLTKPIDRHKFLEMGRQHLPTIREPRRTCLFPLEFKVDGEDYNGKCLDISSGGLFIDTTEKFSVGKVFEMAFVLPGQGGETIRCKGSIAWFNERPNPTKPNYPLGFGVRFVEIGRIGQDAIERFTKR